MLGILLLLLLRWVLLALGAVDGVGAWLLLLRGAAVVGWVMLHLCGNLLHVSVLGGGCISRWGGGCIAGSAVLEHPPGGCAEGDEEEDAVREMSVNARLDGIFRGCWRARLGRRVEPMRLNARTNSFAH